MESVKAFKFMNGWIVKRKHIDAVKDAISINRTLTFGKPVCIWLRY